MGRFGTGQAIRRVEDERLITGEGLYTDDFALPEQASLYFLRSPYAHAKLVAMDTTQARAAPGVVAVFTAADLDAAGVGKLAIMPGLEGRGRRRTRHVCPARAGTGARSLRRRPDRRDRGGEPRAGQRRFGADRRRLRGARSGLRHCRRDRKRRPAREGRSAEQRAAGENSRRQVRPRRGRSRTPIAWSN